MKLNIKLIERISRKANFKSVCLLITVFLSLNVFAQTAQVPSFVLSEPASRFTQNLGQVPDQQGLSSTEVKYYGNSGNLHYYFLEDGITYRIDKPDSIVEEYDSIYQRRMRKPKSIKTEWIQIAWQNSNTGKIISANQAYADMTSFVSTTDDGQQEINSVPSFQEVYYTDLYPGIDLRATIQNGQLKLEYLLDGGVSESLIDMVVNGAKLKRNTDGSLLMAGQYGSVREDAPTFTEEGKALTGTWMIKGNQLGFSVNGRDQSKSLIIDPVVVLIQDVQFNVGTGIFVDFEADTDGTVYALFMDPNQFFNILDQQTWWPYNYTSWTIKKFSPTGTLLQTQVNQAGIPQHTTYMGLLVTDLDLEGSYIYVSGGYSLASWPHNSYHFKTITALLFRMNKSNLGGLFRTKIPGATITYPFPWNMYSGIALATKITADANGNVYATGFTRNEFLIYNAFTAKMNFISTTNFNQNQQWVQLYNGFGTRTTGTSVKLHSDGGVYVVGYGYTPIGGPTTYQALGTNNLQGGLIFRYQADGTLVWSRSIGGSTATDLLFDAAVGDYNFLYFVGVSRSANFHPFNAYQSTRKGNQDGVLGSFDENGNLRWSTYFGGDQSDQMQRCSYDPVRDQLLVGGQTYSTSGIDIFYTYDNSPRQTDYLFSRWCSGGVPVWVSYMSPFNSAVQAETGMIQVGAGDLLYFGGDYGNTSYIFAMRDTNEWRCIGGGSFPPTFDPENHYTFNEACEDCLPDMHLSAAEYVLTAWVKVPLQAPGTINYTTPRVAVRKGSNPNYTYTYFYPSGQIIDGWQRIEAQFKPNEIPFLETTGGAAYFDDIRVHPADGSMKSYVYDPITLRLVAELDERNYATMYEYDEEGMLIRVKKETEKGIMTIQENRSNLGKGQ